MAIQNSSNQKYINNADGWELAGGTTSRKLTTTGSDIVITGLATGYSLAGGVISKTLTVTDTASVSGTNTGDNATNSQYSGLAASKEDVSNKATGFGTVNDTLYPSVQAVKTYADALVVGLLDYRGGYDASGNVFPSSGGSGTAGAVLKGDMWVISVAGTLGGNAVQIGDSIIANVDTPGQTGANWNTLNANISYVPEDSANKVTSISGASTDVQYPSAKLLYDQLALKGAGTVTSVGTGAGLTGGAITSTGTVSLNSKLSPMDTLTGNSLKFLRVNAGETAVEYATVTPGSGTVTNTGGSLTANAVVLGAGTNDTKVVAGITSDGTAQLVLGVNTTTLGTVKMFGSTSGDVTIQPTAVAGTATTQTLPATTGTLVNRVTTANGVSASNSDGALTVTLGAITPTSVNALKVNAVTSNTLISTSTISPITTGTNNTFLGKDTGQFVTDGAQNTGIGASSIGASSGVSTSMTGNTGLGYTTLNNVTGDYNTSVGSFSSINITSGANNTAVGSQSLYTNVTGSNNVALGYYAGHYETSSNAFYVDNQNRTNTAGDKAGALLYGTFNATASSQTLKTNSAFEATYGMNVPTGQTYKINGVAIGTPLTWSAVTADQTMDVNTGYIANKGTLLTLTLPTTSAVGTVIRVAGMNAGLWKISQAALQYIAFGNQTSTVGTGGSIASTLTRDSVELVCTEADKGWMVVSSVGNMDII